MTTVTAQALQSYDKGHGKECLKWKVWGDLRKQTCWGRLFQIWAAATRKARSPTVDSRVPRTLRKQVLFIDHS